MNPRHLLVLAALVAVSVISLPASNRYMPVDEIRPGMEGIGRTVFQGTKVEEFKVHFLGVLRNVAGPRRDLILAKLEGGPLANTGVIAGMSGSPVYVDGRMVGAVSYSLGAFSKEPIAGITPIEEMISNTAAPDRRPATQKAQLQLPITRDSLTAALKTAFAWARPFADRPDDVRVLGVDAPGPGGRTVGAMMRPIDTPLILGGMQPEVADLVSNGFRDYGFLPMAGAGSTSAADAPPAAAADQPLQPGDPVGVNLVSGDLEMGATGTVTEVDGNHVYAFGHPFYNLGPTQFPMTRAYVYTLLPSLQNSMKISTTGEVIGTFQQDRSTAIAGVLGQKPKMIPVNISIDTDRGLKRSFKFQIVDDQLFTPLLTYVSILNTLSSYEREYGAVTYSVSGKVFVSQHDPVSFDDVFTGDSPSISAATSIIGPITFLLGNDFEPVHIDHLDLNVRSSEQPLTAKIERVWVDAMRPKPGTRVPLKILLRTYRGEEVVKTLPIDIPSNATGSLSVLVSDGARLSQWEQREMRQPLEAHGITQMIRAFNNAHRNNRVYVKLLTSDPGGVVDGEYLSSLPPSVLAVFQSDRNGGSFVPTRSATVGEWELQLDNAVSGSRLLTISLDDNGNQ